MTNPLRRVATIAFAFVLAVTSVNLSGALQVYTAHAASNNGTLKVHEKGTLSGTESNDPKVCAFNFEGFKLDGGQTGTITITGQGSTTLNPPVLIPFSSNAIGYGATDYINDGGALTLADGHYKAELDKKFGTDPGDKAKSKVFKVDCANTVTPTMPTTNDVCGTGNDTYTIPAITGVQYKIGELDWSWSQGWHYDWTNIGAGTYTGSDTVKIKAEAKNGYNLAGDDDSYEWTLTFADGDCVVTPTAPTSVDLCGTVNDAYTIPATPGVTYKIKSGNSWITKTANTYAGTGTVVVKAFANAGYDLTGNDNAYEWTFTFSKTACLIEITPAAPTMSDMCGKANDTYTIHATNGVTYKVGGFTKTDTHQTNGDVTVTAFANPGYVLVGQTSWVLDFNQQNCPVAAAAPTMSDICGKANDTYTIPTTAHVTYEKLTLHWLVIIPYFTWDTIAANTYPGSDTVKLRAVADAGYTLTGTDEWTFTFSKTACPQPCHPVIDNLSLKTFTFHHDDEDEVPCVPVPTTVATGPTSNDVCGVANDTFTVTPTAGVIYKVNGVELVGAGPYATGGAASVTITAEAAPGYVLTGQNTWILEFTNQACPKADIGIVAECSTQGVLVKLVNSGDADGDVYVNGDKVTVAMGKTVEVIVPAVLYKANVVVKDADNKTILLDQAYDCTPGRGGAGPVDTPTIPAKVASVQMPGTDLPVTGADSAKQMLMLILLGITVYGATYFLQGRLKLRENE